MGQILQVPQMRMHCICNVPMRFKSPSNQTLNYSQSDRMFFSRKKQAKPDLARFFPAIQLGI